MGVGPRFAIPPALDAAKIGSEDVGLYEINEAFASQVRFESIYVCTSASHFSVTALGFVLYSGARH